MGSEMCIRDRSSRELVSSKSAESPSDLILERIPDTASDKLATVDVSASIILKRSESKLVEEEKRTLNGRAPLLT